MLNSEQWAQKCREDGEFQLAARHWSGGLKLNIGDEQLTPLSSSVT